ncbi:REP-associated tyrosine transposase [Methylotetracoccus oryzae]|uniref:REP-associated tyrosine transposase n=1 Tax=Methylotetracoccus oryzae TaxID=1919059 RepID=UPI00111A5A72|nr:transposase [Methylotetracoccus oryzae]
MPYNNLRTGRHSAIGLTYHVTTVTRDRLPIFLDFDAVRLVVRQLKTLYNEGLAETVCYVLMPDHLHWLMTLRGGTLSDTVRLLKGRTARAIGGSVWQPNFHDHAVRSDEDLLALARYIVANPLRARLVETLGDYPWWDSMGLESG